MITSFIEPLFLFQMMILYMPMARQWRGNVEEIARKYGEEIWRGNMASKYCEEIARKCRGTCEEM